MKGLKYTCLAICFIIFCGMLVEIGNWLLGFLPLCLAWTIRIVGTIAIAIYIGISLADSEECPGEERNNK